MPPLSPPSISSDHFSFFYSPKMRTQSHYHKDNDSGFGEFLNLRHIAQDSNINTWTYSNTFLHLEKPQNTLPKRKKNSLSEILMCNRHEQILCYANSNIVNKGEEKRNWYWNKKKKNKKEKNYYRKNNSYCQ